MYSCSSCCQSCQRSECCNQSDIVVPRANDVYLVSQECIYSNEDKVYVKITITQIRVTMLLVTVTQVYMIIILVTTLSICM